MTRIISLTVAIAALTGCVVVDDRGPHHGQDIVVANSAPTVYDGASGCSFDSTDNDDVWSFQASVDDPDGLGDVVQAWADVYDDSTNQLVQSFQLYPTDDPAVWYSDWLASTTSLDCWYGNYSVDLTAYDNADASGTLTIYPDTYR